MILKFLKDKLSSFIKKEDPKQLPLLGRNDLCHCGSNKKYKKCHLSEDTMSHRRKFESHRDHVRHMKKQHDVNGFNPSGRAQAVNALRRAPQIYDEWKK